MSSILTSVLSCTISSSGISAPTYDEIRSTLVTMFQSIYGNDIVLDNSTQDGQLIGIFSEAIDQVNSACIQVYNSFSPTYAQGAGLSSVVKINGIARSASSYSTADLFLTGSVGTTLNNCTARDDNGYIWSIPNGTVLSPSGVTATATCTVAGSVSADTGTITTINTPTLGWTSVTNDSPAVVGSSVESDASLRQRQVQSTMVPSQTIMDGLVGAILEIPGVTFAVGYENDTSSVDSNGIPANTIALVVEGGDAATIATVIANKKTLGIPTLGTTQETVVDSAGFTRTINFYRPTLVPVYVNISLQDVGGYKTGIGSLIQTAVADYVNGLGVGDTLYTTRVYKYANIDSSSGGDTYDILTLTTGTSVGSTDTSNKSFSFYEKPTCSAEDVSIGVTE